MDCNATGRNDGPQDQIRAGFGGRVGALTAVQEQQHQDLRQQVDLGILRLQSSVDLIPEALPEAAHRLTQGAGPGPLHDPQPAS